MAKRPRYANDQPWPKGHATRTTNLGQKATLRERLTLAKRPRYGTCNLGQKATRARSTQPATFNLQP
ncbi:MAG: hypothetical protein F6K50_24630 [Moorea sp. SIO3I7]|uniref:hypothetical protein n=1 Tax=Moorena sp. SIO3I8 TaxID=2607833 RepID=UPI0013BFD461|nr:hypothetical protein [Moorena sp. SIO3I8]NEN98580.1 hypothetical protein [Moorena sp. SIO3I7]NEO04399.1 hypothetical protein [Moorena sp. SIO3I8]